MSARHERRPNIVLALADSMRAGNVSSYGYPRLTTPHLDGLAASGVRFTNAFTAAPFTMASTTSLLTGVYPSIHRLEHYGQRLADNLVTLPEILTSAGYYTAAFVANPHVSHQSGLTRGFSYFTDGRPWYKRPQMMRHFVAWAESGYALNQRVSDQLRAHPNQPFFFFVFYNDSHVPFSPLPRVLLPLVGRKLHTPAFETMSYTDQELEQIKELYDQALRRADRCIGQLYDMIQSSGEADNTLFIVSADHGEGLDRRAERAGHGRLYENGIHVPLVVNAPWLGSTGREVNDLVSLLDIPPTICSLGGIEKPSQFQGTNLTAYLHDTVQSGAEVRIISEYHDCRCVRTHKWKLIQRGPGIGASSTAPVTSVELYEMEEYPLEDVNVASSYPPVVDDLSATLATFAASSAGTASEPSSFEEDEIVAERLRGLGYI